MKNFLIFLTASLTLFGADVFVGEITPLLDRAGGKDIGVLHVGAKLKRLGESGEYAQIEYTGFVPEESTVAYARLGILEQDFQAKDAKILKIGKKIKDDYDNEWGEAKLKGFVKKSALVSSIDQIYANGESLFKDRCGGCHALHNYDEFNINVWPSVVETMIANSALEPNEFESLVRFLQSKAPIE